MVKADLQFDAGALARGALECAGAADAGETPFEIGQAMASYYAAGRGGSVVDCVAVVL